MSYIIVHVYINITEKITTLEKEKQNKEYTELKWKSAETITKKEEVISKLETS